MARWAAARVLGQYPHPGGRPRDPGRRDAHARPPGRPGPPGVLPERQHRAQHARGQGVGRAGDGHPADAHAAERHGGHPASRRHRRPYRGHGRGFYCIILYYIVLYHVVLYCMFMVFYSIIL